MINEERTAPSSTTVVLGKEELLFSVLDFCDEPSRLQCLFLSKAQQDILTSVISYKWRLERLHIEHGIYFHLPETKEQYKKLFIQNWKRRQLWQRTTSTSSGTFQIRVSARFKPKSTSMKAPLLTKKTVLPFHQRLALIKMNHKLHSNKDALQVLKQQGGWFGGTNVEERQEDNDDAPSLNPGVQSISERNKSVILVDRIQGLRGFQFDHVMEESTSQASVYQTATMPLITEFINGFNATCIVYGQTGSGKTHTMFGSSTTANEIPQFRSSDKHCDFWGIVPRACHEIFEALDYRSSNNIQPTISASVSVSYVEIYGNDVTDLLRNGTTCGHNKASTQRYVLNGSAEVPVETFTDAVKVLNVGEVQKKKATTLMNERSSRAHSLFIVTLRQKCIDTDVTATSRLFLADLGGCEQLKKSQPSNSNNNKEVIQKRYKEAIHINLGLLALKQCVAALLVKKQYVPYSDSKLTLLLSPGLGGDTQTSLIVCGAQEEQHVAETIAAMKFGQMCRGISTTVESNVNMIADLLQTLNADILKCEEQIQKEERWETRTEKRYGENGQVLETKTTTVICGAEESRERLQSLVRQKMELTGDATDTVYATDSSRVESFGAHIYNTTTEEVRDSVEKETCIIC